MSSVIKRKYRKTRSDLKKIYGIKLRTIELSL